MATHEIVIAVLWLPVIAYCVYILVKEWIKDGK